MESIYFGSDGFIKLGEFGACRFLTAEALGTSQMADLHYDIETYINESGLVPPELECLSKGVVITAGIDVWKLGIILNLMIKARGGISCPSLHTLQQMMLKANPRERATICDVLRFISLEYSIQTAFVGEIIIKPPIIEQSETRGFFSEAKEKIIKTINITGTK